MSATAVLNRRQQEIKRLHELSPTFDLDAALEAVASKPRGRKPAPPKEVKEVADTEDSIRREGRFFLEHLENRNVPFVRKTCRSCNRDFLVSYKFVAYCSDTCRAAGYYETYGFVWNPDNSEANRWEFWKIPPSTIRPETLRRLEAFARSILGIEPTPEDLALPTPKIEPPVAKPSRSANRQNVRTDAEKRETDSSPGRPGQDAPGIGRPVLPSSNNDGSGTPAKNPPVPAIAAPAPLTGDRLERVRKIRENFKAGLITAHELQIQLAAALGS